MDIEALREWLAGQVSTERYRHSLAVEQTAVHLAQIYHCDTTAARVAGLLHDCARDRSDAELLQLAQQFGIMVSGIECLFPSLLHGPVGAEIVSCEFPDIKEQILAAIKYHTTGRPGMSKLEQIIYVADIIEPNRNFPGVAQLRELVGQPLHHLTRKVMDGGLRYLLQQGLPIDTRTVKARNELYLRA